MVNANLGIHGSKYIILRYVGVKCMWNTNPLNPHQIPHLAHAQ
jgi:hypothetical protein